MRILHLCLSNFYVDGYSYQENELVRQNVMDGHDVQVIASTEVIGKDGKLSYVEPRRYLGTDGAMVERLPYSGWMPHLVMRKLRFHPGVYARIAAFAPNVILFHSACGAEIRTAARYVRDHPHCKLYIDSHEDFVNSARSFVSKWGLHYTFYRPILLAALPWVEKILPINISALEFMRDFYGVPADKLEFYPLGGHIPDDDTYETLRNERRAELGIDSHQILIVQSGKIDRAKKLLEALSAFSAQRDERFRFVVAGHLHEDVKAKVGAIIASDARIRFLGWQSAEQLRALLCAADIYCQPGTQSATMQMSICCRCAVILDDVPSHEPYLDGNGWPVRDSAALNRVFAELSQHVAALPKMSQKSHELALRMLDYRLLAARIYR